VLRVGIVGAVSSETNGLRAPGRDTRCGRRLLPQAARQLAEAHGAAWSRIRGTRPSTRLDAVSWRPRTMPRALSMHASKPASTSSWEAGGRGPAELRPLRQQAGVPAGPGIGFNHRFIPRPAGETDHRRGQLGPVMYIARGTDTGGGQGTIRDAPPDPARAGGGELLDQGEKCSLVDLCRWLGGNSIFEYGAHGTLLLGHCLSRTTGFLLLPSPTEAEGLASRQAAPIGRTSFDFELCFRTASGGLGPGPNYGTEELAIYRMNRRWAPRPPGQSFRARTSPGATSSLAFPRGRSKDPRRTWVRPPTPSGR